MELMCSACDKPIAKGEQTAHGPDGEVHYRCFKRGTAHGQEVTLQSLHEEIDRLKRRVRVLERTVDAHEANIPFRVGGS